MRSIYDMIHLRNDLIGVLANTGPLHVCQAQIVLLLLLKLHSASHRRRWKVEASAPARSSQSPITKQDYRIGYVQRSQKSALSPESPVPWFRSMTLSMWCDTNACNS